MDLQFKEALTFLRSRHDILENENFISCQKKMNINLDSVDFNNRIIDLETKKLFIFYVKAAHAFFDWTFESCEIHYGSVNKDDIQIPEDFYNFLLTYNEENFYFPFSDELELCDSEVCDSDFCHKRYRIVIDIGSINLNSQKVKLYVSRER